MTTILSSLFLLVLLFSSIVLPVQAQTMRYLGRQDVPHAHDHAGTIVGGLSGLDFDPASNHFVAISDDRSEQQPARIYLLQLDIAKFNVSEQPGFDGVRFVGVSTLKTADGAAHAEGTVDPEAIRFSGDGGYWWASEGNVKRGISPVVEKIGADGVTLSRLELPEYVLPSPGKGVRDNLALESLALEMANCTSAPKMHYFRMARKRMSTNRVRCASWCSMQRVV